MITVLLSFYSSSRASIQDFEPEEIAVQMTVLDAELFYKVDVSKNTVTHTHVHVLAHTHTCPHTHARNSKFPGLGE